MILIFDGIDKSGKTTLKKLFHKKTNYKHIILDRFIASNWVYDKLKNRNNDLNNYLKYDKNLADTGVFRQIIFVSDIGTLQRRFMLTNEKDIKINEINNVLNLYNEYSKLTKIKTLILDTSKNSIETCLEIIEQWISK